MQFVMKLILINILLVIVSALSVEAATVNGVSGIVSDGNSILIAGSSFGSGPNVVVFDDFESGTVGANIQTGSGSAKYGQWSIRYGSSYYGDASAVSGTINFSSDYSGGYSNYLQANLPNVRNIFFTYWMYVPVGMNYPGEGTTDGDNWKIVWVQGASTVDDDYYAPVRLKTSWLIAGNDQVPSTAVYGTVDLVKGQWKRVAIWIKGSTSSTSEDGEIKMWELTSSGVVSRINQTNINTLKATGAFERIRINGYGHQTANCITSFDDVYIASGLNAQARVEIGNASTYADSTKLTVLTSTDWSNDKITAIVNTGSFSNGESTYLYVIDADGEASNGYPITIGGSGATSRAINCSISGTIQ